MIDIALEIAFEKHKNQFDKAGKPYIFHLLNVAFGVNTENEKIVALLHDVIEDTNTTIDELRSFGFYDEILKAIDLLTKKTEISYDEYLKNIKNNELARNVKISDLKHNSKIERLNEITEKDFLRLEKYKRALEYLQNN